MTKKHLKLNRNEGKTDMYRLMRSTISVCLVDSTLQVQMTFTDCLTPP